MYKSFILHITLIIIMTSGCVHEYTPPARPLAYILPSLCPLSTLHQCQSLSITQEQLSSGLSALGLLSELEQSGIEDSELSIIQRGLKRQGYAELDLRRCSNSSIKWIIFHSNDGRTLECIVNRDGQQKLLQFPL